MAVTYNKLSRRLKARFEHTPELPMADPKVIHAVLRTVFDEIGTALSNGEDIYLENFGRFYPDCKPPKTVKSGLTNQEYVSPYKMYVKFTPFQKLNNQVQSFLGKLGITDEGDDNDVCKLQS